MILNFGKIHFLCFYQRISLNVQPQGRHRSHHPHISFVTTVKKGPKCARPAEIPLISSRLHAGLDCYTKRRQLLCFVFAGWICQKLFWTWPSLSWKVFEGRRLETSCWLSTGIFRPKIKLTCKTTGGTRACCKNESNCLTWEERNHSSHRGSSSSQQTAERLVERCPILHQQNISQATASCGAEIYQF